MIISIILMNPQLYTILIPVHLQELTKEMRQRYYHYQLQSQLKRKFIMFNYQSLYKNTDFQ